MKTKYIIQTPRKQGFGVNDKSKLSWPKLELEHSADDLRSGRRVRVSCDASYR